MIGNRHVERHHLGVTRNALRENRLVIFGLCSIGLRRHGPFISCHIFLPLCFALSGTHLGSSSFKLVPRHRRVSQKESAPWIPMHKKFFTWKEKFYQLLRVFPWCFLESKTTFVYCQAVEVQMQQTTDK